MFSCTLIVPYLFSVTLMISLFPEATVSLDKALIDLIQKCLFMREIRMTAAIQPETLYQIVAIVTSKPRNGWLRIERSYVERALNEMSAGEIVMLYSSSFANHLLIDFHFWFTLSFVLRS